MTAVTPENSFRVRALVLVFADDARVLLLDSLVGPGHTRRVVSDAEVAVTTEHDNAPVSVHPLFQVVHRFLRGPFRQVAA